MRLPLLLLVAGLHLSGCAAVSGFPRPALDPREEDAELAPYLKASAITNYEACADKEACRNNVIDARLRAVDLAFYRFQRKIYGQEAKVSLGSDVLAMGLDSVAAITGTKALAAGAGLMNGGRDAYEKQVLSVSLPLLFEEMLAKRREVLLRIRQGEAVPASRYSLFQALNDISEYELAGSIPAAAADLAANAGGQARAAQDKLDALRVATLAAALKPDQTVAAAATAAASPQAPAAPAPTPPASTPASSIGTPSVAPPSPWLQPPVPKP